MTNVISLEDAFAHLEDRISDAANCKKIIIDLMGWILRWNTDRLEGNQVFSFLREFQNGILKNKSTFTLNNHIIVSILKVG
jgi:hypothetical protein